MAKGLDGPSVQVGLGPGHIVLGGYTAPPPQKGLAHVYFGQTTGWIKVSLKTQVGPSDIVLDREAAPPERGTGAPSLSAHVYCGQTAGWIKMPLGTEVGLGQGDIVHILLF